MALNFDANDQMDRFFLLELLIDNLCINYQKLDINKSAIDILEEVSARFYFQDFPPVDVKEEDFCKLSDYSGNNTIPFRSGKSCLFSLQTISPNQKKFQVGVEVYGCVESKPQLLLARTCIELGEYFNNILDSVYNLCQTGPITRAAKNTYPLVGNNGVDVGKITLFIRVSCFGKVEMGNKGPCVDLGGIGDRSRRGSQSKLGGLFPGGDASKGFRDDPQSEFQSSAALLGEGGAAMGMGMPGVGIGAGFHGISPGLQQMGMMGYDIQGMGGMAPGIQGFPGMAGGISMAMGSGLPRAGMGVLGPTYQRMLGMAENSQESTKGDQDNTLKPCIKDEERLPENQEDEKDVLILKIGNKNKVGKLPKLLVELKTPKLKFDEIKTEERQCQYLESDIAPPAKAKGVKDKGKSKKGKGKKGKKK